MRLSSSGPLAPHLELIAGAVYVDCPLTEFGAQRNSSAVPSVA
jgi:hypothetical protein